MEKVSCFKDRCADLMSYFQIKQVDICNKTGIQKSTMSNFMSGVRNPRQETVAKICHAYNVNPMWLMGFDCGMFDKSISEEVAIRDAEIITKFNLLSKEDRDNVMRIVDSLISNK